MISVSGKSLVWCVHCESADKKVAQQKVNSHIETKNDELVYKRKLSSEKFEPTWEQSCGKDFAIAFECERVINDIEIEREDRLL